VTAALSAANNKHTVLATDQLTGTGAIPGAPPGHLSAVAVPVARL